MKYYVVKEGNLVKIEMDIEGHFPEASWECDDFRDAVKWREYLVNVYAPKWLAQGIRMWRVLKEAVVDPDITKLLQLKAQYGKGLQSNCALCHIHYMLHSWTSSVACDCPLVTCESGSPYWTAFCGDTVEERQAACDTIIEAHYEMARILGVNVYE